MADVIDYKIFGDDMQLVEIELDPGCVYLQRLPFSRLADRIFAASRFRSKGEARGPGAAIGGGLLAEILGADHD